MKMLSDSILSLKLWLFFSLFFAIVTLIALRVCTIVHAESEVNFALGFFLNLCECMHMLYVHDKCVHETDVHFLSVAVFNPFPV